MDPRIGITGVAALTPLGDSLEELVRNLCAGQTAIEDLPDLSGVAGASMKAFDATRYANVRGLRLYNTATRLGICAAKLALNDAGLAPAKMADEDLGVVTASTCSHLETLIEYDRSLVTAGVQRTNPALMPLAIPSAPGAVIALSLAAKAFSVTVSDGATSSLDALGLATRLLEGRRARACVVVGAAAICKELALSASRGGAVASADGFRVFDRSHRGLAFGDAGAAVVLERVDDAAARGVRPRALIAGQASTFAPDARDVAPALQRACVEALARARKEPSDVDLVSAGAAGAPEHDRAEARALLRVLGDTAHRTPVIAVKAALGESVDATGLLQCLVAVETMRSRVLPPIPRLYDPDVPGLRYITAPTDAPVDNALVTATSQWGSCSAVLVSRHDCT